MSLIHLDRLGRTFGAVRALDAVSLDIAAGEWIAVTGPSGSGKTTLLNLIAGLDSATDGRLSVGGTEVSELVGAELARYRSETVGIVFQDFHLVPYLTATENVMLAQYVHSVADATEAEAALERVGLGSRLRHLPSELSGGEKQRVCIARALINHPRVILADEPTGNLDEANEDHVLSLFEELREAGQTLVVVTHNPKVALHADRVVQLEHGRLMGAHEPASDHESRLLALWRGLEEGLAGAAGRRTLAWARRQGHAQGEGEEAQLTPAGRAAAGEVIRRQRLAEALFSRAFDSLEVAGCGELPPLAESCADDVCGFLGHPEHCPHGLPIPRDPACCLGLARTLETMH